MAGIKLLEKRAGHLDFIINELTKPEIKAQMFDDFIGGAEISMALYNPFAMVYGIFEKGRPVPIGVVILDGLRPFRGCEIHAAIFRAEDRNAKKLQGVVEQLKYDLLNRWNLHYACSRVLSTNSAAGHILEKCGMKKLCTKPGNIQVNGQYLDVDEYYIVLNGDELFKVNGGTNGR